MDTRKNKFNKTGRGLLVFLAMVIVIAVLLAATDKLPSLISNDFAQRYNSIEDAGQSIGYDIRVPAYFPEGISWPPSMIIAQKKPYKAVLMEFKGLEKTEAVLVISQSLQNNSEQFRRITMTETKEKIEYRLKGRTAVLMVGKCGAGMSCSEIAWQENGRYFRILLMTSPFELIKIAESMMHR